MEFEQIITLITTVGFPIAVCIWLLIANRNQEQAHAAEIDKLRTALENNTLVIQKLIDKLGE